MSDPELGRNTYNRRLVSIRTQLGIILDAFTELNEIMNDFNDTDPGPQEKMALLLSATNAVIRGNKAVIQGSDDVLLLEQFGRVFKDTGELNTEILKGRMGQ